MAHTLNLSNMEAESSDCRTRRTQKTFAVKRKEKKEKIPFSNIQGEPQNGEVNPYREF